MRSASWFLGVSVGGSGNAGLRMAELLNILGLGLKWWMIWEMKDLNNQNSAAKKYKVENHTRQIQPVIINLHAFSPKWLMPEPNGDSHMFGSVRWNVLI